MFDCNFRRLYRKLYRLSYNVRSQILIRQCSKKRIECAVNYNFGHCDLNFHLLLGRRTGVEPCLAVSQTAVLNRYTIPCIILERHARIELALSAWKAEVLPLNECRKTGAGRENRTLASTLARL